MLHNVFEFSRFGIYLGSVTSIYTVRNDYIVMMQWRK